MLEYAFFQEPLLKRFQSFLQAQGLIWTLESNDTETLVVIDEAGLDHELADRIESLYDELFELDQSFCQPRPPVAADEGVAIRLGDGRVVYASLPDELVSRLLTAISPSELANLVDTIASAVLRAKEPTANPGSTRVLGEGKRAGP